MYKCKTCSKEFEGKYSYIGHCSSHKRNEAYKLGRKKIKEEEINLKKICKYCQEEFESGLKLGGHQAWCKENPDYKEKSKISKEKLSIHFKGRKLSDEHKKKLSENKKEYLIKNPDKVPYKLNHSSKISYPERYFLSVLKGFDFQYKVPGTLYEIDFANPDKKIAIEIDGEQHYVDQRIIEHDIKRDQTLEDLGWKTIRIRWSHYKSLSLDERKEKVLSLMNFSKIS